MDGSTGHLAMAAQRGNREAFAELIRRHERTALGLAYAFLGDADAAGDAVQESFLTAWKRIGELQEPEKFPGWLCQIVRSTATDAQRREQRDRRHAVLARELLVTRNDSPSRHDLRDEIPEALARLDVVSREVMVLRYYDGLSSKEIGALLWLSPAAVDMRLSRARHELREHLAAGARHG